MAILFYDHLVERSQIDSIIDESDGAGNHKGRALQTIDDIIFQGILSLILDQLPVTHHRTFLAILEERPYDPEILIYLREHIGPQIESDLQKEAERLVQIVLKDLDRSVS